MRVQKAIEVTVPANRVWPYFVEPEMVLQWSITFKKFEYTSNQRSGVGTPIYIEEQASGQLMKMNFEVTEWKENEKVALRMISGGSLKSYEQSWSLEPTTLGSKVTFMEDIELPYGVIGKLLGLILEGMSNSTADKMLAKLKSLVEA
jgi:uncharacterized protein YndB with AHSA1/START domain